MLDKGHKLTLIVGRPATADNLAFGGVFDLWIKRVWVQKLKRIKGLHVVVPVEKDMGATPAGVRHDHWVPRCWTL